MGAAAWVALGSLVVNNLVGNLIEPRFMRRGLGLSTLVVFGAVGMFLAVPLTMMAKIALDSFESTRWVADPAGSRDPAPGGRGTDPRPHAWTSSRRAARVSYPSETVINSTSSRIS